LSAAFSACGAGWLSCRALPRNAFCPCRKKLIDSPKIRAASCGAWNPVEFSASSPLAGVVEQVAEHLVEIFSLSPKGGRLGR
jgi:hypothetical protein